jgi:hypothetical protein
MRSHLGCNALLPLLALAAIAVLATLSAGATVDQDVTVTENVVWDEPEYDVSADITVGDGGHLVIKDSTLTFFSPEDDPIGILVDEGGELTMSNVTLMAEEHPYGLTAVGGSINVISSTISGLRSVEHAGELPNLAGGLGVGGGQLYIENVTIESEGVGLTIEDSDARILGLTVSGGGYGLIVNGSQVEMEDVHLFGMSLGIMAWESELAIENAEVTDVNFTLWTQKSDVTVVGMVSSAIRDHLDLENGTASVRDSEFNGSMSGVMAVLGYIEVVDCTFEDAQTAISYLYCEGEIRNVTVVGAIDEAIVLEGIGFFADEPRFELDNVTIHDGTEAALVIEDSYELVLTDLTILGHGDGINARTASFTLSDSLISGSSQFCAAGCSYTATGTGILLESAIAELYNVTIVGSNGPAVTASYSIINATDSSFSDGNVSGFLLVYAQLRLDGCEVSGNAAWGVEALAYYGELDDLDATWGNGLADVRLNMTTNVKVFDQDGSWLSHAEVTAKSGQMQEGPHLTGFGGSTATFELAVDEWDEDDGMFSFNPWTFEVVYGDFSNSTEVEVVLGVGQVNLYVTIPRADLEIESMKVPEPVRWGERTNVAVVVVNSGSHPVDGAVLTLYYRNENGFQRVGGEETIPSLAPGDSTEVTISWNPPEEGSYTIIAHADVDDRVEEEDDDNNFLEQDIQVEGEEDGSIPAAGALASLIALVMLATLSVPSRRRRE